MNPLPQPRQFLSDLQRLARLLFDHEDDGTSPTLRTLLNEICRAAAMIRGGCSPRACEDFAMRRIEWRVQYDLVDDSTIDQAMRLLRDAVVRGIELLRHTDWRTPDSRLISMITAQTGIDLVA